MMTLLPGIVDGLGETMRLYFGAIGAVLVATAIVLAARRIATLLGGETTTGRVVGHRASTLDDSTTYHPVIEFRDWAHKVRQFTAGSGRSARSLPEGTTVPVRYQRANPEVAFVPTFMHMWAGPLALAVLGSAGLWAFWSG